MRNEPSIDQRIAACSAAYDLATHSADADLDEADWLWHQLQLLRHERDRTLTPAQIRAAYGYQR